MYRIATTNRRTLLGAVILLVVVALTRQLVRIAVADCWLLTYEAAR